MIPTIQSKNRHRAMSAKLSGAQTPVQQATEPFAIPEGYMTGDEFSKKVISELRALYEEHGLI
jgi:hypothetical protein